MSEEVLDLEEVLERVQDDKELLLELFDIFQEDYEQKRRQIGQATVQKDFEQLKNIAHSLKGASSNISAKRIYSLFAEIERMAVRGDMKAIEEVLVNADREYAALQSAIEKCKKEFRKSRPRRLFRLK